MLVKCRTCTRFVFHDSMITTVWDMGCVLHHITTYLSTIKHLTWVVRIDATSWFTTQQWRKAVRSKKKGYMKYLTEGKQTKGSRSHTEYSYTTQ